jgi:hypothetical protein
LFGEYLGLGECGGQTAVTLVAIQFDELDNKTFGLPFPLYLRVRDLGGYHYRMESVTDFLPKGCVINREASSAHPWLSAAELKALR